MTDQNDKKRKILKDLVEAVDEVADEGQLIAPKVTDLKDKFEIKPTSVMRLIDEDYAHVVRTAGYVPQQYRTIGDKVQIMSELDRQGEDITVKNVESKNIRVVRTNDGDDLSHNQMREKLGLEPNEVLGTFFAGKVYDLEDKDNILYEFRRRNDQSLEQRDKPVSNGELRLGDELNEVSQIKELRKEAGIPYQSISKEGNGTMTGERESEVFEFWVDEYLERDWEGKEPYEIDTIMKMSMTSEGIEEWELNGVASEYKKWLDNDRYQ